MSREAFTGDLRDNLDKLSRLGVNRPASISYRRTSISTATSPSWTAQLGLQLINFTPGTLLERRLYRGLGSELRVVARGLREHHPPRTARTTRA